jgi:hypothetical protein
MYRYFLGYISTQYFLLFNRIFYKKHTHYSRKLYLLLDLNAGTVELPVVHAHTAYLQPYRIQLQCCSDVSRSKGNAFFSYAEQVLKGSMDSALIIFDPCARSNAWLAPCPSYFTLGN